MPADGPRAETLESQLPAENRLLELAIAGKEKVNSAQSKKDDLLCVQLAITARDQIVTEYRALEPRK